MLKCTTEIGKIVEFTIHRDSQDLVIAVTKPEHGRLDPAVKEVAEYGLAGVCADPSAQIADADICELGEVFKAVIVYEVSVRDQPYPFAQEIELNGWGVAIWPGSWVWLDGGNDALISDSSETLG